MQKSGFFWHTQDETLLWYCDDYDKHVKHVRTGETFDEQKLHLRLFKPVKGQLPQEVVEAGEAYGVARKSCDETRKEAAKSYSKAGEAYGVATRASNEAGKALSEALSKHKDEIEALHSQECFDDCPWDGKTIFPFTAT